MKIPPMCICFVKNYFPLCPAKTSYARKMNDLAQSWIRTFSIRFLPGLSRSGISSGGWSAFSVSGRTSSWKIWLSVRHGALSTRHTTSPSMDCPAQAVLGRVASVQVRVDQAPRLGHSWNRRVLASGGVSFVLDMGLQSQTGRRTEACQQRGARFDLPYGCRESDLGSTAHSRRTAEAWFRRLGKECLATDPAGPERTRSFEAMGDVPQKPSRGNCCDGPLHRPNAHVWCSVLLFRHWPRLA